MNNLNDNPAEFLEKTYTGKYPENVLNLPYELPLSSNFIQLSDADLFSGIVPINQIVPIDVRLTGAESESFRLVKLKSKANSIENNSAIAFDLVYGLEAVETLDAEKKSKYEFEIHSWDGNFKEVSLINIDIQDLNDNPPIFKKKLYNFNCDENVPKDTIIGQVEATDIDITEVNNKVFYRILSTHATPNIQSNDHREAYNVFDVFRININTGEVSVENSEILDREIILSFNVTIMAYNMDGIQNDISHLILTLNDVNDNSPKFRKSIYNIAIREKVNNLPRTLINLKALDLDLAENGTVRYRIESINGKKVTSNREKELKNDNSTIFYVNQASGNLVLNQYIDMDTEEFINDKKSFEINIVAYDMGSVVVNREKCLVIVKLIDINDQAPEFFKPNLNGNCFFSKLTC